MRCEECPIPIEVCEAGARCPESGNCTVFPERGRDTKLRPQKAFAREEDPLQKRKRVLQQSFESELCDLKEAAVLAAYDEAAVVGAILQILKELTEHWTAEYGRVLLEDRERETERKA
jgi:hypothetical protein